jgi:hypothetical protein
VFRSEEERKRITNCIFIDMPGVCVQTWCSFFLCVCGGVWFSNHLPAR